MLKSKPLFAFKWETRKDIVNSTVRNDILFNHVIYSVFNSIYENIVYR